MDIQSLTSASHRLQVRLRPPPPHPTATAVLLRGQAGHPPETIGEVGPSGVDRRNKAGRWQRLEPHTDMRGREWSTQGSPRSVHQTSG